MMNIIEKSETFVTSLFKQELPNNRFFHCLGHTKTVVSASRIIGTESGIDNNSMSALLTAAWFHDTGHTLCYTNHEEESQRIAHKALSSWGVSDSTINKVKRCIEATKLPQSPQSEIERIICDADMYHLSQDFYWENNALLKKELSRQFKKDLSDEDWYLDNLQFLKRHKYFTKYGQKVLEPKKQLIIKENRCKLESD